MRQDIVHGWKMFFFFASTGQVQLHERPPLHHRGGTCEWKSSRWSSWWEVSDDVLQSGNATDFEKCLKMSDEDEVVFLTSSYPGNWFILIFLTQLASTKCNFCRACPICGWFHSWPVISVVLWQPFLSKLEITWHHLGWIEISWNLRLPYSLWGFQISNGVFLGWIVFRSLITSSLQLSLLAPPATPRRRWWRWTRWHKRPNPLQRTMTWRTWLGFEDLKYRSLLE